jgi:hypothetical protein
MMMFNPHNPNEAALAADHAKAPHISIVTNAYYLGRQMADFEPKSRCPLTTPALVDAWLRGRRDLFAEDRLNADTEWDRD